MTKLQPGDKVAYSVQWLRSTGQAHSHAAHARGTVIAVVEHTPTFIVAKIHWTNTDEMPHSVNVCNLAKVGANTRFAAC